MAQIKKINFFVYLFFIFGIFFIFPVTASAANLFFSPAAGSYQTNETFTVNVYVTSADTAINAAAGVVSFPSDKMRVVSLSKSGSIFNLWVQEPTFSNIAGTVTFEGVVLNPGFIGSNGKIFSITFSAKNTGLAALSFISGSALANDGSGTNVLAGRGKANFSIKTTSVIAAPKIKDTLVPSAKINLSPVPVILSFTHPESTVWYKQKNAQFAWNLPKDITSVRLGVSTNPVDLPDVTYAPPIKAKEFSDLSSGVWYFSVRAKNNIGWGEVGRFKFQIDVDKPEQFEIKEIVRTDNTEPTARFIFTASDQHSGIDHYEIQIDGENLPIWQDDGSHIYQTSALAPGKHILIAQAVDKSGNALTSALWFTVDPIQEPVILNYQSELSVDDTLIIRGSAEANCQIKIWLQKANSNPVSFVASSDRDGRFTFVAADRLSAGVYQLWAEAIDMRGARSLTSEKLFIKVVQSAVVRAVDSVADSLVIIVPLAAMVFTLLFILWFGWRKLRRLAR